jgi:GNAT superfamily N-acetyltransferase
VSEEARRAAAEDLPAIVDLYRAATAELRTEKGGEMWAATTGRDGEPDLRLDDEDLLILVGTFAGVIVGYARVERRELPERSGLAVLTDVYVEPAARGVGIGEAMLDAVVTWASDRGCRGIDSLALPGMRDTKNFFEAAGLVARAITVHRSL